MEIWGFKNFLLANKRLLSDNIEFNDSKLIIDGSKLITWLYHANYRSHNPRRGNDIYGGDLISYHASVTRYFQGLIDCKIKPIVVFGGPLCAGMASMPEQSSNEYQDKFKKNLTIFLAAKSANEQLDERYDFAHRSTLNGIFRDVLTRMDIKRVQAPCNSSSYIVSLANENNCPAATNDSKFILHKLKKGFIFFEDLSSDLDSGSIKCSVFAQKRLIETLPGLEPEVLPFILVFHGKKYNKEKTFDYLIEIDIDGPYDGPFETDRFRSRQIANVLHWLRNKSLEQIKTILIKQKDATIQSRSEEIQLQYGIRYENDLYSELDVFYNRGEEVANDDESNPAAYLKRLMESGDLDSFYLTLIFHQTIFVRTVIDNFALPASGILKIRPFSLILALLRPQPYTGLSSYMRRSMIRRDSCEIYDRVGRQYENFFIEPMEALDGFGTLEHLDCRSMITMDPGMKAAILRACFRFTQEELELTSERVSRVFRGDFAKELTICLLLIKYIGTESRQQPDPHFVEAVLSTFFYYATTARSLDGSLLMEVDVLESIILQLEPFTVPAGGEDLPIGEDLFRRCVHFISQLHSAYDGYTSLNALLSSPYHTPNLGLFLNCVLLYMLNRIFRMRKLQFKVLFERLPVFIEMSDSVKEIVGSFKIRIIRSPFNHHRGR